MWKYYAVLSAVFTGLTAILAKMGLKGISGTGRAIRTVVIVFISWGIVLAAGQLKEVKSLTRNNVCMVLSGVATGLSWIFYFKKT